MKIAAEFLAVDCA